MHALPLKIYRREIASKSTSSNLRTSSSIDRINAPGGTITRQTLYDPKCNLVNTMESQIDFQIPNNTTQQPGKCAAPCFLDPANNARRRVRSAGMMRNKYDPVQNNYTYSTGTNQYLVSRNLTYQQNQYNFIRQGDPNAKPGTAQAKSNVYSANGQTHCPRIHISALLGNNVFYYYWIESGTQYTITIPDGYYNVDDFNSVFKTTMYKNGHYYVAKSTLTAVYMLNILYDNNINKVVIQASNANAIYANGGNYTYSNGTAISGSAPKQYGQFEILETNIQNILGFAHGIYPSSPLIGSNDAYQLSANQSGSLKPTFVAVIYKPNNPQFAQQGAVSASSRLVRVKYNTINTIAATYTKAYGANTANALAYGVSEKGYTIKDKMGYPNSYTRSSKKCNNFRTRPFTLGF